MTCCIVGLLILTVVSRLRRVLGRSGETAVLFAPVARRPAPGQTAARPHHPPTPRPHRRETAVVFRYASLGITLCLMAAPALVWMGLLENTGTAGQWLLRSACYLVLAILVAWLSRTATVLRAPPGAGTLLVIVGVMIFELGMADMHLFRVLDTGKGNLFADMAFHSVGPVVTMLGGLLSLYGEAGRTTTSRRSSRSTETRARPPASAVTVSSSPPMTT